jgi:hypothetical protein
MIATITGREAVGFLIVRNRKCCDENLRGIILKLLNGCKCGVEF